jgi:Uri superfamily endonuclease
MLAGEPGYYLYIGSAFGPGGLTARLAHHCRIATRLHWHIDYLRSALPVVEIWRACHAVRREWLWVKTMGALPGARVPMPGFGASDHRGATHLFRFDRKPSLGTFAAALEAGGARKETLSRHVPGE